MCVKFTRIVSKIMEILKKLDDILKNFKKNLLDLCNSRKLFRIKFWEKSNKISEKLFENLYSLPQDCRTFR